MEKACGMLMMGLVAAPEMGGGILVFGDFAKGKTGFGSARNLGNLTLKEKLAEHRRWLYAYFLAVTGDPEKAEDLRQEVLRTALRRAGDFQRGESLSAWLRGIARNFLKREFEKRGPDFFLLSQDKLDELDAAVEEEGGEADQLRVQALRDCIGTLETRSRRVLAAHYQDLKSIGKIAASQRLSGANVKVILHRARALLMDCVKRKMEKWFGN